MWLAAPPGIHTVPSLLPIGCPTHACLACTTWRSSVNTDAQCVVERQLSQHIWIGASRSIKASTMALGKKAYPRATVKKIIKAHSNMNVKKNADVTVSKAFRDDSIGVTKRI